MRKVCKGCKESLPLSDFTPHKRYSISVLPQCRDCYNKTRASRAGCEKTISYSRQYYAGNKQNILGKAKDKGYTWHKQNKDLHNARNRQWTKDNPEKNREKTAKRRAAKLNATPPWLSDADKAHINRTYKLAQMMQDITGDKYHVDHIVPLQGKNVCGLHVPQNLQVLRADLNLSKSNIYR